MSGGTPIQANGAYFADQIANSRLDPFAVFGLHADDIWLSMSGARYHFRHVVMPHVFERNTAAASSGPRVPTWQQVNIAKEMMLDHGKDSFKSLKAAWSRQSVQVWNAFAPVGSQGAKMARVDRYGIDALAQLTDRRLHG